MAVVEQVAPILGGTAAVIGALGAAIIGFKNSRPKNGESSDRASADRAAVAVTNFERTSVRVEALWDTIHGLVEEVAQLREDKIAQQQQIDQLKEQLDIETRGHMRTRAKLARVEEELAHTKQLLLEKEKQITELLKGQNKK